MDNNKDIQQELFALPIGNKVVAKVEGTKLYSNDKLKEKYVKALEDRNETKKVSKEFKRLVKEGKIVPCWLNKGILRFIAYKIFAPFSTKGVLGFFHPESGKFYIIIDNNMTAGISSNTMLAKLTLHESMHMLAHKRPGGFIRLFSDELDKWFYNYFIEIFDLDTTKMPKNFSTIKPTKFLFQNVEIKMNIDNTVFKKYRKMVSDLCKPYTKLEEDEFEKRLSELTMLPRIYYGNLDSFMQLTKRYKYMIDPMYNSYSTSFGIKGLSTLCIQELMYPSEIVCIIAESKPSNKIYQGIKRM